MKIMIVAGIFCVSASLLLVFSLKGGGWFRTQFLRVTGFYLPDQSDQVEVRWFSERAEHDRPLACYVGMAFFLKVQVKNTSKFYVGSDPRGQALPRQPAVNLGQRLYDRQGVRVGKERERYFLAPPLPPGDKNLPSIKTLSLPVSCPELAGEYLLSIELVQEGVAWQSDVDKNIHYIDKVPLQVLALDAPGEILNVSGFLDEDKVRSLAQRSVPAAIKKAFFIAVRLLDASLQLLHRGDESYRVSDAGSQYPMLWVRDMATIDVALNQLWRQPRPFVNHWASLFWDVADLPSEIPDWVALNQPVAGAWFGKNTVTSDQELWLLEAVLAALEAHLLNVQWLDQKTKGKAHKLRMQEALGWLLTQRFNDTLGCLWSGHTIDWGDVGLVGFDNISATQLSEAGGKVCSTYTQVLFLRVAQRFARFAESYPTAFELEFLDRIKIHAQRIQTYTERELWEDKLGFFRIHQHTQELAKEFIHTDQGLALGAQVLAWQAGLVSAQRLARVGRNILRLQKRFGISTISGVLLPPYPNGLYQHPSMQAFSYQNGGQWDWWGAQAVLMLYAWQPQIAKKALGEIAEKVVRNHTFYEWEQPSGEAGAGRHFRAGAAAFLSAVLAIYDKPADR